jgi:hypothetical protein
MPTPVMPVMPVIPTPPTPKVCPTSFCFAPGTIVHSASGPKAIETISLGEKVLTHIAEDHLESESLAIAEIETSEPLVRINITWETPFASGSACLLRPVSWANERHVRPGQALQLSLPEMGISDSVFVASVDMLSHSCISRGTVTACFRHRRGHCVSLRTRGCTELLCVTPLHQVWSIDRGSWVSVNDLQANERLQGIDGILFVDAIGAPFEIESVYNIEVAVDHCYRVGTQGMLVHNASDPCGTAIPPLALNDSRFRYRTIDVNVNRTGGGPPNWQPQMVIRSMRYLPKNMGVKGTFSGGTEPNDSAVDWVKTIVGHSADDAGHAVGQQFGGRGIRANVYPQEPNSNRNIQRTRENRVKARIEDQDTCRVCIQLLLAYGTGAATQTWYRARPTGIRYLVWVDGVQFEPQNANIANP